MATHANTVIVAGGTGNADNIQTYDVENDVWKVHLMALPTPTCFAGAAVVNEKLYIVGGYDFRRKKRLSTVEVFDFNGDGFSYTKDHKIPLLEDARTDHAVVTMNDEIYVIGGFDADENFLTSCEVINTSSHERYDISPLNEGRSHLAAVILDNYIIAIGGKCDFGRMSTVECYSFETKLWTFLPSMKTARWGHCACVYDRKIFVVGGQRTKSIEYFDLDTNTWTYYHNIQVPRWGSAVAQIVASNTRM